MSVQIQTHGYWVPSPSPPPLPEHGTVKRKLLNILIISNLSVRVLSRARAVSLDESAANLSRGAPHQLGVVAGVHQQVAVVDGQLGRGPVLNLEARKFSS